MTLFITEKCLRKSKKERIKLNELHKMLSLLSELSITRKINTDRKSN
jgi:hypothetical protein